MGPSSDKSLCTVRIINIGKKLADISSNIQNENTSDLRNESLPSENPEESGVSTSEEMSRVNRILIFF